MDKDVISCQTSQFQLYRIEGRVKTESPIHGIKIEDRLMTESWKEIPFKQDLKEILGELSYSSRHDAIRASLCYELSGEMAGLIVHQLTIKHPSLEFRLIPMNVVFDWKITSKGKPLKMDLTFKDMEPPNEN